MDRQDHVGGGFRNKPILPIGSSQVDTGYASSSVPSFHGPARADHVGGVVLHPTLAVPSGKVLRLGPVSP